MRCLPFQVLGFALAAQGSRRGRIPVHSQAMLPVRPLDQRPRREPEQAAGDHPEDSTEQQKANREIGRGRPMGPKPQEEVEGCHGQEHEASPPQDPFPPDEPLHPATPGMLPFGDALLVPVAHALEHGVPHLSAAPGKTG